jgi:antibiotic biosynthesis monooxygenase (ABM) superfamily enzyme
MKTEKQNSGAWLVATHKVESFERWKPAFDGVAAIKRGYGWKQSSVYAIDGDRNNVLVMEEFDTLEHAKAFASSPELKAALGKAGVVGAPEIRFANAVAL